MWVKLIQACSDRDKAPWREKEEKLREKKKNMKQKQIFKMALTQAGAYGGAVETLSNHHLDGAKDFGDKKVSSARQICRIVPPLLAESF